MARPRLYLSHEPDRDCLYALEYGTVPDGQPAECWQPLNEEFEFYRLVDGGPVVGFRASLAAFDPDDPELAPTWEEPLFDVPLLGLREVPAAAIVRAAREHFGERASFNKMAFDRAVNMSGEEALEMWQICLESGDSMAHFAIGYTLYELERFEEAYRHLRYYVEIAPSGPWSWCWLGKCAEALGEIEEARATYQRAVDLTDLGSDETEAPELLAALEERASPAE